MSRATELTLELQRMGQRPAGSDAERRAAQWARSQINRDPRRHGECETFWARPNWALAQTWHIALAVTGSVVSSTQPTVGAAIILAALAFTLLDWLTPHSPGRWLTRERASQNVISTSSRPRPVRLIITARLDTGSARVTPLVGWLFWDSAAMTWLLITAIAHTRSGTSGLLALAQLIPTMALLGIAAWLWLLSRQGDEADGVGAALALIRVLDAAAPANLAVDLVLSGAGAGYGLGLRRYLRRRRRDLRVTNTVVIGIGSGTGAFYLSMDGPLIPLRFFGPLQELARQTGMLTSRPSHGCSAALPARLARLPGLSLGGEPDRVVEAGLELVEAVDAYVGRLTPPPVAGARQTSRNPRLTGFRRPTRRP